MHTLFGCISLTAYKRSILHAKIDNCKKCNLQQDGGRIAVKKFNYRFTVMQPAKLAHYTMRM